MNKIKTAIIGYGLSSKVFHLPLLLASERFEICAVLTTQRETLAKEHPGVRAVSTIDEIVFDSKIELVINTAPNEFHYPYCKLALENNKHVVVEKPFVNTVTEGEELMELAQKKDKLLSVFHNRRFDCDFLTLKKLIKNNKLGNIKYFESHFDRFRPDIKNNAWREEKKFGSGVLFDLGSHLIDQALQLFGWPDSIFADIETQKEEGVIDDYFHIILKYRKLRVVLHSTSFGGDLPRFYLAGQKGTFIKFGLDPQEGQLRAGQNPHSPNFGMDENQVGELTVYSGEATESIIRCEKGSYLKFYLNIYECIRNKIELPLVSAISALDVIKIIEKAKESAKQGKSISLR